MASRNTFRPRTLNPEAVCIMGSFAPNGSSAVAASSRKGRGWTVARTSTGLFTVTFTDKFNALLSATATLQLATPDDKAAQIGTWTASTKALQILVFDASAAAVADVAADANDRINFVAWFMNSSLAALGS